MNSLANGKLFGQTDIQDVFIQAAAGDAGTALGAALFVQHTIFKEPRRFVMEHAYWGPQHDEADIRKAMAEGIPGSEGKDGRWGEFLVETVAEESLLCRRTAEAIANGEVVGWYQGRSEWGPRALGNRSILADPRRADMRGILNLKIKRREAFRPFAPSILEERTGDWFTINYPDPFMIKVYPIRPEKRPQIPAVTHADGTGRLQTVSQRTNPRYWRLIKSFEDITGVPVVLNTSFNENEPIVNTPAEALDCFFRTRMDRIVLGDVVVYRQAPPSA
jgi:carbamoyltransferase